MTFSSYESKFDQEGPDEKIIRAFHRANDDDRRFVSRGVRQSKPTLSRRTLHVHSKVYVMYWPLIKAIISAVVITAVSEIASRYPRLGALLLTLPMVSILAFVWSWQQHHDLPAISRLARETLVLVPLGLAFFVPLAFAERMGLNFWSAMGFGVVAASVPIVAWFTYGPRTL